MLIAGDVFQCKVVQDCHERLFRLTQGPRKTANPDQRAGIGFGAKALDDIHRPFGHADHITDDDLMRGPAQTKPAMPPTNGLQKFGLAKKMHDLDDVGPRQTVDPDNIVNPHQRWIP